MSRSRAREILNRLKSEFNIPDRNSVSRDPFELLVVTVLSQSTTSINTRRAFKRLKDRFNISPECLVQAEVRDIEEAIRVGGLYRNKARVLKALSKEVLERFGGSLDFIYRVGVDEARERLMSLPGVGPKTSDVVLLFAAGRNVLPIDTHIDRVSKRLHLAPERGNYEAVRRSLESLYETEDYLSVHFAFINLGRKYCKARRPLCRQCPVSDLCPSKSYEKA